MAALARPSHFDRYQRFSALPWPICAPVPLSRLAVRAWCEAIVHFWQACARTGVLDSARPLPIIDLAPGDGQLAWQVTTMLRAMLGEAATFQPCYLPCAVPAPLPAIGTNPAVVLWIDGMHALPQELHAVHHGDVYLGVAALEAAAQLAYDWRRIARDNVEHPSACALLDHYRTRMSSAALTLPISACDTIDALAATCAGPMLLIATDGGCCTEQQVRLGALSPPASCDGLPLPVNFHALAHCQQGRGALTWNRQLRDDGAVLHAALHNGAMLAQAAFEGIAARLEAAHPDDRLDQAAAEVSPHAVLALLRISAHDPQVLRAALPALETYLPSDTLLKEWHATLATVWSNYLPVPGDQDFCAGVAVLAGRLGHWDLARHACRSALALGFDQAKGLYWLALCDAATGRAAQAMRMLDEALHLVPAAGGLLAMQAELAGRLQRQAAFGDQPADGDLRLEPLGPEHAASLCYQYRDPQIAAMVRLPPMETPAMAEAWIAGLDAATGCRAFAVMHACWGFVGMVALHGVAENAFFYFWIGSDYQDAGLGRRAASMLLKYAGGIGIDHVYTLLYASNRRSRDALEHLGFSDLPLRPCAPEAGMDLLHRSPPGTGPATVAALNAGLHDLCHAIGSPLRWDVA